MFSSSFYQLSYPQQADLLQKEGLFLLSRKEGNFVVDLYELQDLLIEIYYRQTDEEPVSVLAHNAVEKLRGLQKSLAPRLTIRNTPAYRNGNRAA